MATRSPSGLACSTAARYRWEPVLSREEVVMVTSRPSTGRRAPQAQVFSGPRP
ncbi:hypothetical protein ACQCSX_03885 [Pseudarthrobacter sp. P1]|uniref:hypothetical protein n=1 Tax=Pseudarthrobacter sp. P1 TaxID=3418418 RepID=UPI003CEA7CE3